MCGARRLDSSCFPPIGDSGARVLILGSLPGQESLRLQQYYAHPRNLFWKIIEAHLGVRASDAYPERIRKLAAARVALWDVCAVAHRPGSLDTSIRRDSVVPNDLAAFLVHHPRVTLIAFNGAKAADLFRKHVQLPNLPRLEKLPSTSPANAGVPYADKLRAWAVIRAARDG